MLLHLATELPSDLVAALFIAIHTAPEFMSPFPELLSQRGCLPAAHPVHLEEVVPGRIYIAPPDNHLLLRSGYVEVVRGPKENGHRPAVDPLFRTASWSYGPRVIGLVLSGHRDCGTAGMMSVKARSGVTIVQSPESAVAPEMPRSVLARGPVDHVVHPLELAGLLVRLTRELAEPPAPPAQPPLVDQLEGVELGAPVEVVCPSCHGVLTEARVGEFQHFRCHVGHAFSLDSLARAQSEEVERALWAAARALEEGAVLNRRLVGHEKGSGLRRRFADKAKTLERQAEVIHHLLLHGEPPASHETD